MVKASRAFVLSCLIGVVLTARVMADEGPFATFHVKLESNPAQNFINPVAEAPITKDTVAFRIMNNTGEEVWFMAGEEKHYVPMVSENTFEVPYLKGDAYKAVDNDGNVIAHWAIQDGTMKAMMAASAAETSAKYNTWGQSIQRLIQSNQQVAVSTYRQETQGTMRQTNTTTMEAEEGSTVRGFW